MNDLSTGPGTCSGSYADASPAFGGTVSMTVAQLLNATAAQSDPGSANWNGNDATLQGPARDTFSAMNNQKAFRG